MALVSVDEPAAASQGDPGHELDGAGGRAKLTTNDMAVSFMETEIRSQPALLARLAEEAAPLVADLGRVIVRRRPRFAILAARGTSDHAAIYGKYLLETEGGLVASPGRTVRVLRLRAKPGCPGRARHRHLPVWAVPRHRRGHRRRQTGRSPDARGDQRRDVAARAGRRSRAALAGRIRANVAATKTFTAELLALWLLVGAVAGAGPGAARGLGQRTGESLAAAERALAGLSLGDGATPIVVVGRGYSFPIALEIALKLREGGLRNAQGYSAADLLHGSIAAVHAGTAAILVGAAGPTVPSLLDCATALRERGARTIVISDVPELREGADVAIPVQAGCESLTVIPIAVAGQWLALQDAVTRGLGPDRPPGLVKVIRTVERPSPARVLFLTYRPIGRQTAVAPWRQDGYRRSIRRMGLGVLLPGPPARSPTRPTSYRLIPLRLSDRSAAPGSSANRSSAIARATITGPRNIPMAPKAASPPRSPMNTAKVGRPARPDRRAA